MPCSKELVPRPYHWKRFSKLQFAPKWDFKFELFPLHSPLLGESLLVSFPPLIDMLKFSGYSYLIWDHGSRVFLRKHFNGWNRLCSGWLTKMLLNRHYKEPRFHSNTVQSAFPWSGINQSKPEIYFKRPFLQRERSDLTRQWPRPKPVKNYFRFSNRHTLPR